MDKLEMTPEQQEMEDYYRIKDAETDKKNDSKH